jgi:hypothetical protein
LFAVGGLLAVGAAIAQEAGREGKPTNRDRSAPAQANAEPHALPVCLEVSQLTQEQRGEIQKIIRDYDEEIASVWKQFSDRYMETVRTEALLLSAIEDNLTEAQQQQVRQQRRRVAHREESLVGTKAAPNQSTEKPESAIEEQLAIVGVPLTPEQESAADKIQEGYLSRLRSLNRDIDGFHTRLVSLEADKFVEIEKVLTKDQLQELREIRQTAPAVTAKRAASRRTAPQAN